MQNSGEVVLNGAQTKREKALRCWLTSKLEKVTDRHDLYRLSDLAHRFGGVGGSALAFLE